MSDRTCLMIVLAAGEGTRMKSVIPKVLHEIAGRPIVAHALGSAVDAGADRLAVVVGPGRDDVAAAARKVAPSAEVFVQADRLGTAHAVLQARAALSEPADDVVVLYGDTPLVTPATLGRVRAERAGGSDVVVLGFEAADPTGYGRLLIQDNRLVAIREERDASLEERRIRLSNSGIMGFRGATVLAILEAIGNANAKGEYYLTDAVEVAGAMGLRASV
eukprot:gene30207-biopygen17889